MNKKELLRKLRSLAEQGVGGEKLNAQKKLEEMLKKYNISDKELDEETVELYHFKVRGERERLLIAQIMYKVCNRKDNIFTFRRDLTGRKLSSELGCECTASQRIEIELLFDFYKRLYNREEKFFFSTFIQKHRLFGELKDGEEPESVTDEERLKMEFLMEGMSNETPVRQIQYHSEGI